LRQSNRRPSFYDALARRNEAQIAYFRKPSIMTREALKPRHGGRLGAPTPDAFKARGVIFLTPEARFSHLLALPEGSNLGHALNQAMDDIENNNPDLADALPKNYGCLFKSSNGGGVWARS
jgi:type I restriction-modification system DNA methylase subunit